MPEKSKLDWFKLDCQTDDKLELIEAEFGLIGFAVIVRLWQKIYGGEGYYCEWNEDVALVFAKKNNVGAGVVSEIILAALRRGIFDSGMYEKYGILTSHGIQTRYFGAAGRRKCEKIKNEYLLREHTQNSANVGNSSPNVNISTSNVDISSQKREEKNRREKKRGEESISPSADKPRPAPGQEIKEIADMWNEICRSYPKVTRISDQREKAIRARLNKYSKKDLRDAFEKAEKSDFLKGSNPRSWSANFDWVIKDSNIAKILDGNYDNRSGNNGQHGRDSNTASGIDWDELARQSQHRHEP